MDLLVGLEAADVPTFEEDLAGGRAQDPGEQIDKRSFARPIRPDQCKPCALFDLKADVVGGDDASEALLKVYGFQHRGHAVTLLQARLCAATGGFPIGRSNSELAPSTQTFFRARLRQSAPTPGQSRIANTEELGWQANPAST